MSARSIYFFGVAVGAFASWILDGFHSGTLLGFTAVMGAATFLSIGSDAWRD